MESNLDRLEDRVLRAVRRIQELTAERRRLDEDVEALQRRLVAADRRRSGARVSLETGGQADAIAAELHEAIRELRDA